MIKIVIWSAVLCLLAILIPSTQTQVQLYKKEHLAAKTPSPVDYGDFTPQMIVRHYINASLKGDEKTVGSLISETPASFSEKCEGEIRKSRSEDNSDYSFPKLTRMPSDVPSERKSFQDSTEKFVALASSDQMNSIAYVEALYLYSTQAVFKEIKIIDVVIFKDEAFVNVEYVISDSDITKRKYLLKNTGGWKIFNTLADSSNLPFEDNDFYGQQRPKCK